MSPDQTYWVGQDGSPDGVVLKCFDSYLVVPPISLFTSILAVFMPGSDAPLVLWKLEVTVSARSIFRIIYARCHFGLVASYTSCLRTYLRWTLVLISAAYRT